MKRDTYFKLLVTLLILSYSLGYAQQVNRVETSTSLCSFPSGIISKLILSDDGKHIAFISLNPDNSVLLTMDRMPGIKYSGCGAFTFSPDSKRFAYVAADNFEQQFVVIDSKRQNSYKVIELGPIFSLNSEHFAYCATLQNNKGVLVYDGKETQIDLDYFGKGSLSISPDGSQFAVNAVTNNMSYMVVNGHIGNPYYGIGTPAIFSPNSQRFAFGASSVNNHIFIVLDGIKQKEYDAVLTQLLFSSDSKRFGYIAKKDEKQSIVIDGVEGNYYDYIIDSSLVFSPDSKQYGYIAYNDKKMFVVINGKEQKRCDAIGKGSLIFSPDSRHFAYIASQNGKESVIVDENEGNKYYTIWISSLTYSPDSERFAYMASDGLKQFVVIDGIEDQYYDYVGQDRIIFSPDSKNVAYGAYSKTCGSFVVLNGKSGKCYDNISTLIFSPKSSKLAYRANIGGSYSVVINGIEGKYYKFIGKILFTSETQLYYIAGVQPYEIVLIEEVLK